MGATTVSALPRIGEEIALIFDCVSVYLVTARMTAIDKMVVQGETDHDPNNEPFREYLMRAKLTSM